MEKNPSTRLEQVANKVSLVTIAANVALSVLKLGAGLVAHSGAMISDAVHSASDVFSTLVVMIGIKLAARPNDSDHPYGHERLECVAAILLSVILLMTGLGIGADALGKICGGDYGDLQVPGALALAAAVLSILVKEAMYWYTRHHALQIDSGALLADAWHHRSDALSSVGALVGILGARMGFPVMDPAASLVIFFFIAKAAWEIFRDAMDKMVDRSWGQDKEEMIRQQVLGHPQVLGIDRLRSRVFGSRIFVDVDIRVRGDHTLREAHAIAEQVHDQIEARYPKIKHIMVHVNPAEQD